MKKYRDDQADAAIENALNDIALNPYDEDAWNQNRQQIENAYELKLRGASDEVKDLAWANFKNDTAVARFNAMLQDDPGKADEWYQANKDSFSAESRLKAENALETYRVQSIVDISEIDFFLPRNVNARQTCRARQCYLIAVDR